MTIRITHKITNVHRQIHTQIQKYVDNLKLMHPSIHPILSEDQLWYQSCCCLPQILMSNCRQILLVCYGHVTNTVSFSSYSVYVPCLTTKVLLHHTGKSHLLVLHHWSVTGCHEGIHLIARFSCEF